MANVEPPVDDRRDDDGPDVELPGVDVDGSKDFVDDATGATYDEQADRAQDAIDRAHRMAHPDLEPDDASAEAQAASEPPGPDADARPV